MKVLFYLAAYLAVGELDLVPRTPDSLLGAQEGYCLRGDRLTGRGMWLRASNGQTRFYVEIATLCAGRPCFADLPVGPTGHVELRGCPLPYLPLVEPLRQILRK